MTEISDLLKRETVIASQKQPVMETSDLSQCDTILTSKKQQAMEMYDLSKCKAVMTSDSQKQKRLISENVRTSRHSQTSDQWKHVTCKLQEMGTNRYV